MNERAAFEMGMAGVAVVAHGPRAWIDPLSRAWAPWVPDAGVEPWQVTLEPDAHLEPPTRPLFDTLPRCQCGRCTLIGTGFAGEIDAEAGSAHLRAHPDATPGDAGYFLRVVLALQAFVRGGLLFHAAGVVHHGQGYALFGLSGSGKTTASKLSAPDPVLNDDLILLWPNGDGGWWMHSTPFGKGRGDLRRAPLRALLRLIKDLRVSLSPLSGGRALGELVSNTPVLSADALWLPQVMTRWRALCASVPVHALHFRKDSTFWEVIDAHLG